MFNFNINKKVKTKPNLIKKTQSFTDKDFILYEINNFENSQARKMMITGEEYYAGQQDILKYKRMVIGEDGELEVVHNLPNNKIIDNQYQKMVDQKNNYLLGKPFVIQCDNDDYAKLLKKQIFTKKFMRLLKGAGEDSLNEGIAYLYPYYDDNGNFFFKVFKGYESIPGWKDANHTELEYFIYIYKTTKIDTVKKQEVPIKKVEVYDETGVYYFTLENNELIPDAIPFKNHFYVVENGIDKGYNWQKIPIIPLKYNKKEIPLIKKVKSLQDGINTILSTFENNMQEDARNTILVLINYAGENLGEFRHNLAQYGVVKTETVEGVTGDLKSLQIEVNADNYKAILELFKKALIENAMGYDAKDDRLGGNANQLNIKSMYSDIDLDANNMETEYQAAFEEILWFVNCHFANIGLGDFENEEVEIIFNRDMLMDESEIIEQCKNSSEILSEETIIANHPWVDDPQKELERKKQEEQSKIEQYDGAFKTPPKVDEVDEE